MYIENLMYDMFNNLVMFTFSAYLPICLAHCCKSLKMLSSSSLDRLLLVSILSTCLLQL